MKYFENVLADYAKNDKINITIHCDIGVFSWLLDYMTALESKGPRIVSKTGMT